MQSEGLKSQTQVVVIGGGIAGLSTLYHLTCEGWSDVVLLERDELTSGTTWHSAAQVTNFGPNQTMVGLKTHSINLYKELSEDPEHPIIYHHGDGGIRLANTQDQLDGYAHFTSMAKGMGVEFEVIDAAECARRHPLISTDNLLGGLWDPLDGDIDPAQLCQALARRARAAGAQIYRQTPVTGLTQRTDNSWIVGTTKGDIKCQIVVNAGGYRCNEVGLMMGVTHPVISMEHQYFLTEDIAAIADAGTRMPLLRCPISDYYCRQEKNGLLIGFYEQGCKTWGVDGIDPHFSNDLCPSDTDRVMDILDGAFARMPAIMDVGIHTIVNGPITYSADGLPLVGPVPGKRNAFCIVGLRAGLGEGGGHGWLLAQQIVHGEACYDTWCLDPRRFGPHATQCYTVAKSVEDYRNEFRFHMPHEHRPAGRPARTTDITADLGAAGAEFAVVNGWERAAYFKPSGDFSEQHSFRFNNAFDIVAHEVSHVSEAVGCMEVNGFTRLELRGDGIHDWLETVLCSRVSRAPQRVRLGYFLNDLGCVKGEVTVANLADGRVWLGSAAAAEDHDFDWLSERLSRDGSIEITRLTESWQTIVIAGPAAHRVLESAVGGRSSVALPWLSVDELTIASCDVVVMAVSYSGELAYELHVPADKLRVVWHAVQKAGAPFDIKPFGLYAADSMRLEKGYRHWKADLITEYDPYESGLGGFVRAGGGFVGAEALAARRGAGPVRQFASLKVDCAHAAAHPGGSLVSAGQVVGTVTSAGWGHRTQTNIAMGFLEPDMAQIGAELGCEILGKVWPAQVIAPILYVPDGQKMRAACQII